jgi:hypothetical protein
MEGASISDLLPGIDVPAANQDQAAGERTDLLSGRAGRRKAAERGVRRPDRQGIR